MTDITELTAYESDEENTETGTVAKQTETKKYVLLSFGKVLLVLFFSSCADSLLSSEHFATFQLMLEAVIPLLASTLLILYNLLHSPFCVY